MRFLLDQSADARLLPYLRSLDHDATRIATHYPSGASLMTTCSPSPRRSSAS